MGEIKGYILIITLYLSHICFAQVSDDLMLYRNDFQNVSGNNTVSITSYEKNGAHFIFAGGAGSIDVYNLNKEGKLSPISNHELYKKKRSC